jgi:hypothetical protein
MTDSTPSSHPGLGEATDISATDLDPAADPETPATSDPAQYDDDGLGNGDGPELGGLGGSAVQPGGSG